MEHITEHILTTLGVTFLGLALISLLGLLPSFARHFYPNNPRVLVRAAAPVIFSCLAMTFFCGTGLPAIAAVLITGVIQIGIQRRRGRGIRQSQPAGRRA